MKNIVLFRLKGDNTMWLADLEAGTVEPTDSFDAVGEAPRASGVEVAIATTARSDAAAHVFFANGESRLEGVDVAIAGKARSDAAAHVFFANGESHLEGVDVAIAGKSRSDAAAHVFFPSR